VIYLIASWWIFLIFNFALIIPTSACYYSELRNVVKFYLGVLLMMIQ
jgi:hypothetical protein